ncbi:MAG: hypothetical protein NZ930_05235 [Candidatus Bipolaricaulota bacterium]|nr:hypothetical protein [Candidatus Bipolaricaulota bacterium]MDW8030430.1 sigma factor [Candidatus Bipolaricaulota bacterium]
MNRVTMTELLRRVCEGNREAWAQFYEQFKREVIGVCMAILHNEHEALDAAEETFLKVFSRCDELNSNGNARSWPLKIAANVCKDNRLGNQFRLTESDQIIKSPRQHELPVVLSVFAEGFASLARDFENRAALRESRSERLLSLSMLKVLRKGEP